MEEEKPKSQAEANRVYRVLSGKPLKYTLRLHRANGSCVEWQSDRTPTLKYNDEARALYLVTGGSDYSSVPVIAWVDGDVLITEENQAKPE